MGGWVCIVTAGEVTVVRANDRVWLSLLDIASVPLAYVSLACSRRAKRGYLYLTNAWTTGVGKDQAAEVLESLELAISLNGSANLLRSRCDSEHALGLDTVVKRILSNRGGTAHVLVRGVCAGTDQTDLELLRPLVLLNRLLELAQRGGKIWGERSVDVWLELAEVDLDEFVVLGALVFAELLGVGAGEVSDVSTLGGSQVVVHAVVEWEEGRGGTDFSTHVADS